MEPSAELIEQLRTWIGERIPEGGTEADTRFTDAEISAILERHDYLESAAAEGWRLKASLVIEEGDGAIEKTIGDEKLKFLSPKDKAAHFLALADLYDSYAPTAAGAGSRLMAQKPLDVLGTAGVYEQDISRLIGYCDTV